MPLWNLPSPYTAGAGPKAFIDMQNDVGASDIQLAVREGFQSVEHVKRYTAMGFGTDQGKLGNINGMGILAQTLGQSIAATGTTTYRPNYTPISFGAFAGSNLGDKLFDPVRKTAMHAWHEENGADVRKRRSVESSLVLPEARAKHARRGQPRMPRDRAKASAFSMRRRSARSRSAARIRRVSSK